MPRKKKFITKKNSTKYILLKGRAAVNADGETLPEENRLIPVAHNHKPGASLLMSGLAAVSGEAENLECADPADKKEPNLDKILEFFEDDSEGEGSHELKIPNSSWKRCEDKEVYDDRSDISDILGQFDDADFEESESCDDEEEEEYNCNTGSIPDGQENMKLLNERFEKLMEEYDESNIGALDDEEICGPMSTGNEHLGNLVAPPKMKDEVVEIGACDEDLKQKIFNCLEMEEEEHMVKVTIKKAVEYDCESIISTYSNKYNHPAIIKSERKINKIQIPNNPLKKGLTKSKLKQLEEESDGEPHSDDQESVETGFNIRRKGETPEERRERKSLFKEARRESRILKKENKLAFKNEKKIRTAIAMNAHFTRGVKLI